MISENDRKVTKNHGKIINRWNRFGKHRPKFMPRLYYLCNYNCLTIHILGSFVLLAG